MNDRHDIDLTPVREAWQKTVDSLNNALDTASVTNRIARAVGTWERAEGLERHMFPAWLDLLDDRRIEIEQTGPDSEDLDAKLIETAALCVRWLKQRDRQRQAGQG